MITETDAKLSTHEMVCAVRYEGIQKSFAAGSKRMEKIEYLIYIVIFALITVFVGTYQLLVRPKSLRAGITFGAFIGLALGLSAGFGTYIHMPIPLTLAWGWLIGGWLKGIAAGAVLGSLITDSRSQ